jgi:cell division protein FtsW (lipid II flippase)
MKAAVTILVFCVGALLALGMVMLYSSSIESLDRRTHTEIGSHDLVRAGFCVWTRGVAG